MPVPSPPLATYRLQLHRDFGFQAAEALVPYLHDLGVSHLYSSPIFAARKGSRHGYDVTDPTSLNPELGARPGLDSLSQALRSRSMGLILDIVPNHLAASSENPAWMEVLAGGQEVPSARVFDIHWRDGRVVLPILGDRYGDVLERGEVRIEETDGGWQARYFEHRLPLRVDARRRVALAKLAARLPSDAPTIIDDEAFWLLHGLLEDQPYRLTHWRMAAEINPYRRFFDINDLVGVRVEDDGVFEQTHRLLLMLVEQGLVSGVRVDHIDGLADPKGYLHRLREALVAAAPRGSRPYLVVEKVLVGPERLRRDWPVDGTTGYDFLAALAGVFLDHDGVAAMEAAHRQAGGSLDGFEAVALEKKRLALRTLFKGEHRDLCALLHQIAQRDPHARDIPPEARNDALASVTAALPVYRTYIQGVDGSSEDDGAIRHALNAAQGLAQDDGALAFLRRLLLRGGPAPSPSALSPEGFPSAQGEAPSRPGGLPDLEDESLRLFFQRWQQLTGPLTAKGVEDTALFAHAPVIALNEVGRSMGAPTAEGFHAFCLHRRQHWPNAMSATSTHDTKWSEDVRARAFALTELGSEWAALLPEWGRLNQAKKTSIAGVAAPDANEESLIYQAMVCAWPLQSSEVGRFRLRLLGFVLKAMRESKVHTAWTSVNPAWERAVQRFVDALLADRDFMAEFYPLQKRIAYFGAINSLSQVLVKATAPGVPDFYQGQELWDFSLVDPDNRRPVDFVTRRAALESLKALPPSPETMEELLATWQDGRIKLYITMRALALRQAHPRLFQEGDYIPLAIDGPQAHHAFAFARRLGDQWAITVVPRLVVGLGGAIEGPLAVPPLPEAVVLPEGAPRGWRDVLDGQGVVVPNGLVTLGVAVGLPLLLTNQT